MSGSLAHIWRFLRPAQEWQSSLSSAHIYPGLLVQRLVLNPRRQDLCTVADEGDQPASSEGAEKDDSRDTNTEKDDGKEKNAAFRNKIEQLRELKRQKEELDRKYESYFTVEYALKFAQNGFQDSEDDDCVCSSDSEHSNLEITLPSPDDFEFDD